jgi:hypothetical protein
LSVERATSLLGERQVEAKGSVCFDPAHLAGDSADGAKVRRYRLQPDEGVPVGATMWPSVIGKGWR